MNDYQTKLFSELMDLVESNDAFYYKDCPLDGAIYRIFNYRLCKYDDWLQPSAMECRGHMFEVTEAGEAARLASLPMGKFFNLNENPMTMDLDLSTVARVETKADGSLISTYIHEGELRLKSKGSLDSEQAVDAMAYLEKQPEFASQLRLIASKGWTVNLEWCGPNNRIVISYQEPHLTVLNIRSHHAGRYISPSMLGRGRVRFDEAIGRWIGGPVFRIATEGFVASIPSMEGVEGFVLHLESGQRVKVKTEWYLVRHRSRGAIDSPRRLFEACLAEATDDLRSMFHDDPVVIAKIAEMEEFSASVYNELVAKIEGFHQQYKDWERKDYAIRGQRDLEKGVFGLAMSAYLPDREPDYKRFLRKNYKAFGIGEEPCPPTAS